MSDRHLFCSHGAALGEMSIYFHRPTSISWRDVYLLLPSYLNFREFEVNCLARSHLGWAHSADDQDRFLFSD